MNTAGIRHRLPRHYRLAWTLLWFALLGALTLFDGQPKTQAPSPTLPQLRQAWLSAAQAEGGEPTDDRTRAGAAAAGAAFRQP